MPERKCDGCTRQAEWGCTAVRWREPEGGRPDDVSNWVRPSFLPTTVQNEEVWFCPRQSLKEQPRVWSRLLMFYQMFKAGFLPDKGAVVDQSNGLIEALRILEDENMVCDQVLQDRDKSRRARNARGHGNAKKGRP